MGLENLWLAVAERHDNQHRLGFALRDQIVENHVRAADSGPRARVVTESVQQIEDGIGLIAARVVAGRGINEKAAIVAYHARFVEMMMNFAMRDCADLPGKRCRSGDMHFAGAIEKVRFYRVIRGIEEADTVGGERVAVIIRREWIGGDAPYALVIFLHGQGLAGTFDGNGNFFYVGCAEAERHAAVGMDLG